MLWRFVIEFLTTSIIDRMGEQAARDGKCIDSRKHHRWCHTVMSAVTVFIDVVVVVKRFLDTRCSQGKKE